jgi:hypothetical protein
MARRVGSATAASIELSGSREHSTIWLNVVVLGQGGCQMELSKESCEVAGAPETNRPLGTKVMFKYSILAGGAA